MRDVGAVVGLGAGQQEHPAVGDPEGVGLLGRAQQHRGGLLDVAVRVHDQRVRIPDEAVVRRRGDHLRVITFLQPGVRVGGGDLGEAGPEPPQARCSSGLRRRRRAGRPRTGRRTAPASAGPGRLGGADHVELGAERLRRRGRLVERRPRRHLAGLAALAGAPRLAAARRRDVEVAGVSTAVRFTMACGSARRRSVEGTGAAPDPLGEEAPGPGTARTAASRPGRSPSASTPAPPHWPRRRAARATSSMGSISSSPGRAGWPPDRRRR